jgi:hypothetical protein
MGAGMAFMMKIQKESTFFCEQKEAKKLYSFQCRVVSTPREAEQKFFGSFFQKRTCLLPLSFRGPQLAA